MIDEKGQEKPLVPPSVPKPISSQQNLSQASSLEKYLNFMTQRSCSKQQVMDQLIPSNIYYNPNERNENMQIQINHYMLNQQVIEIQVSYSSFTTRLKALNVDSNSKLHHSCASGCGGYGDIFLIAYQDKQYALKCLSYTDGTLSSTFRDAVSEFFILKIASALRIGPYIHSPFGFDLIVYRNCIEFTMEICQYSGQQGMEEDLKQSLHLLHSLKIIHFDIKPQNINFSPTYHKYIFLDFGLSKIIPQQLGQKSRSIFRGSVVYCSSEMQSAFFDSEQKLIDLYYNDAQCLRKTLAYFKQKNQFYQIELNDQESMGLDVIDCRLFFELFSLKWQIYNCFLSPSKKEMMKISRKGVEKYCSEVVEFIGYLPQSQAFLRELYGMVKQMKLLPTSKSDISIEWQINEHFKDRMDEINNTNCVPDQSNLQINHNAMKFEVIFKMLKQFENYKFIDKDLFSLIIVEFLRVQENNNAAEQKNMIAKEYLKLNKCIRPNEQRERDDYLSIAIEYIFQQSFASGKRYQHQLFSKSILSLLFLQIKSQQDLKLSYQRVLQLQMQIKGKLTIIIKFLIALKWIQGRYYSSYCIEDLLSFLCLTTLQFLSTLNWDQMEALERQLLLLVERVVSLKQSLPKFEVVAQLGQIVSSQLLLLAGKKIVSDLNSYIQLWQLQLLFQGRKYLNDRIISKNNFLAQKSIRNCSTSICYYSTLIKIAFLQQSNKSLHVYFEDFQRLQRENPFFRRYQLYIFYKLSHYEYGRIQFANIKTIFEEALRLANHYSRLMLLSELIRVFVQKRKQIQIQHKSEVTQFINQNISLSLQNYLQIIKCTLRVHRLQTITTKIHGFIYFTINHSQKQQRQIHETLNNFITNYFKLVSQSSCLECKAISLFELRFMQADLLTVNNRYEESFLLRLDLAILTMKQPILNYQLLSNLNLLICYCKEAGLEKYATNLSITLHSFISKSKNYAFYFQCSMDGQERIRQTYNYLLDNGNYSQLFDLLDALIEILSIKRCRSQSTTFFNAIYGNILPLTFSSQKHLYYQRNSRLISHYLLKPFSPYTAYYLFILFLFKSSHTTEMRIIKYIALSINYLDSFTRRLILNRYFFCFLDNVEFKQLRRRVYILKLHIKHCFSSSFHVKVFSSLFLKRYDTIDKKTKYIATIKKCLKRYYDHHKRNN